MSARYKLAQCLKVTILARVSAHGDGLYLYIPKDVREAYGILAGHKIEVQLLKHFRPETFEEGGEKRNE